MAALRDRTNEFLSVAEDVVMREGGLRDQTQLRAQLASRKEAKAPLLDSGSGGGGGPLESITRSEFSRAAAQIGRELNTVVVRLQTLAKLAKRKTLFDDKPLEINKLITDIKQDIAKLSANIGQLQAWQRQKLGRDPKANGAPISLDTATSRQSQEHSMQIVTSLQAKLANTSEAFKNVLEIRTQNMKEQKNRKDQFSALPNPVLGGGTGGQGSLSQSGSQSSLSQFQQQINQQQINQQQQVSQSNSGTSMIAGLGGAAGGGSTDSPLYNPGRRRNARAQHSHHNLSGISGISGLPQGDYLQDRGMSTSTSSGAVAIDFGDSGGQQQMQQQQQQMLVPMNAMSALNQELIESRSTAIESIESTIAELGQIYQSFATMVATQREMVQRIDENVLDIEMNVTGAHSQLMTYYQNVSSNRWLILKVLAVLVVFFLMFVLAT